MNELVVDYISDLHLSFYLKASSNGYEEIQMDEFISRVIEPQAKGEILVVAGDITEFTKHGVLFLKKCAKYYKKVFFVAGNHEYYISYFLNKDMKKDYDYASINKINEMRELVAHIDNVELLDRNSENGGIAEYKGFKIAGDTFWYVPKDFISWLYYIVFSLDSKFIHAKDVTKVQMIKDLHQSSIDWYNNLPDDLDLIVTHVPPIRTRRGSCYFYEVDDYKAPVWIFGHDHTIHADIQDGDTRLVSNPWGCISKDFKVKTLTLKKDTS